jgi:hypothetical protein
LDLFGIIAGNLYVWLGCAIICALISIGIFLNSIRKVGVDGLVDAMDQLTENPGQVAKPVVKTGIRIIGFYLLTACFWFLFIISLILNAAVWIKHS